VHRDQVSPLDPAAVALRRRLVGGCGDVSYAAAGHRRLRLAVVNYGWLSPTAAGCRSLRRRVANCVWPSPTTTARCRLRTASR